MIGYNILQVPDQAFDSAVLELASTVVGESNDDEWFHVGCFEGPSMATQKNVLIPELKSVPNNSWNAYPDENFLSDSQQNDNEMTNLYI